MSMKESVEGELFQCSSEEGKDSCLNDSAVSGNEYITIRKKNMKEQEQFLKELELSEIKSQISSKPTEKIRKQRKRKYSENKENDATDYLQLMGKKLFNSNNNGSSNESQVPFSVELPEENGHFRNNSDSLPMQFEEEEDKQIFLDDNDEGEEFVYSTDLSTCSLSEYEAIIKGCKMWENPTNIISNRITALNIHPSTTKYVIIAGDLCGNLSLLDMKSKTGLSFRPHTMNVTCVSFSKRDAFKFYSTSHEGIVRCADINTETFDKVFSTSTKAFQTTKRYHTTWHDEFDYYLYVALGNGEVSVIDLRENTVHCRFKCHDKSVRTVQSHPVHDYCFMTSSSSGEVSIWDIRNTSTKKPDPLSKITFGEKLSAKSPNKGLTSSFFSSTGDRIVVTCNDYYVRIINSENLANPTEISKIRHDSNIYPRLSPFRAQWLHNREDLFHVGSMSVPKRIEIYSAQSSNRFHQLTSDFMTSYCPLITAHPSLPLLVGGNAAGEMHVFSPNNEFQFGCDSDNS